MKGQMDHQPAKSKEVPAQSLSKEAKANENICPCCSHYNDIGASFCEECGSELCTVLACRKCGHMSDRNSDLCGKCGEWLGLEGLCKYCYAPIQADDRFCTDCGRPSTGIKCPVCSHINHSDFCSQCFTALTDEATVAVEMMREDVAIQNELQRIETILGGFPVNIPDDNVPALGGHHRLSDRSELDRLRVYKNRCNSSYPKLTNSAIPPKSPGIFSDAHKESIENLNAEIVVEEERLEEIRRLEEEKRRLEEERKRIEAERERLEEERRKKAEERRKAENQGNVIYSKEKNVKITVRDENCALDDAYMLYVNNDKVGLVDHKQGGYTTYQVKLNNGDNTIKLALHRLNGCGSWFTISVMPGGRKLGIGGSNDHYIKVVIED